MCAQALGDLASRVILQRVTARRLLLPGTIILVSVVAVLGVIRAAGILTMPVLSAIAT